MGRPPGIVSPGGGGKFPAVPGGAAGPRIARPRPGLGRRAARQAPGHLLWKPVRRSESGGQDSQSGLGVCSREAWEMARVFPACTILGPAAFSESDEKF